jgi:hypothetical protein
MEFQAELAELGHLWPAVIAGTSLPGDAIIHPRPAKQGLVVVSESSGRVLKLFHHPVFSELLKREASALKSYQGLSAPHFVAEGKTSQGAQWLLTSFCPNTAPFKAFSHPCQAIADRLESEIYPVLQEFYRTSGVTSVALGDWVQQAKLRAAGHPSAEKILQLIGKLEVEREFRPEIPLLKTKLHADLNENNIHRSNMGCSVIDWENQHEGLLLMDAFDLWARALMKRTFGKRIFLKRLSWGWALGGDYERFLAGFLKWQQSQFQLSGETKFGRLYYIAYTIERILVLHETMKVDRFYRRGLETRTWQALA